MGIVKRQTILSTIFIYSGVILGFFSTIFLKPFGLTSEEIGVISLIDSVSGVASIFFSLGLSQVIVRKFSFYKNVESKSNDLLSRVFILSMIGFVVYAILAFIFPDLVNQTNGFYDNRFFVTLISVTVLFRILYKNLDAYVRMNYNSTLSIFVEGLLLKTILFFSFLFVRYDFIDFDTTFILTVLAFSSPGIIILGYSIFKYKWVLPKFTFGSKASNVAKEWSTLSFFGVISSATYVLILYTDQLMVNSLLGTNMLGIYSIMFFIGAFINIPSRGLKRIATAFLSDYWSENDTQKINDFYKRSSISQGVLAVYVFICIWFVIEELMMVLPPEYSQGKYVILFIGLGQVLDMLTGINAQIIATSKLYRWNSYFNIALVIITIINNFIFISYFGLKGAAIATLVSLTIINIARYYLLKVKYNLEPFSKGTLVTLTVLVAFLTTSFFVSFTITENPYVSVFAKTALISLLFWFIIIKLKVSEDINELIFKYYKKLFGKG